MLVSSMALRQRTYKYNLSSVPMCLKNIYIQCAAHDNGGT